MRLLRLQSLATRHFLKSAGNPENPIDRTTLWHSLYPHPSLHTMPALEVRPLQPDDLPALMAVQRAGYGDGFMESTEVFARRMASPVN